MLLQQDRYLGNERISVGGGKISYKKMGEERGGWREWEML
jgi:hypothetical protein